MGQMEEILIINFVKLQKNQCTHSLFTTAAFDKNLFNVLVGTLPPPPTFIGWCVCLDIPCPSHV